MSEINKIIVSTNDQGKSILSNIIDYYTGEPISFKEVTSNLNGDIISDSDIDGIIYIKYNNKYYKRICNIINIKWFGALGDSSDCTSIFQKALDYIDYEGGGTLYIPTGVYITSKPLTINNPVSIKGDVNVTIKSNSTYFDFIKSNNSIEINNIQFNKYNCIINHRSVESNIDLVKFIDCNIKDCNTIYSSNGTSDYIVNLFDILNCVIDNITSYAFWIDFKTNRLNFINNKVSNVCRYIIRALEETPNGLRENIIIDNNIITNIHSGEFEGSSGVSRCFQISADYVKITNNSFKDLYTNINSSGNLNVLYGSVNNLYVENNKHINFGLYGRGSMYLYHDKGGSQYNHIFKNNIFELNDDPYTNYGICIHSTANGVLVDGNIFNNLKGRAFYAGWGTTRNLIYTNNIHRNFKGHSVVQLYGNITNINHSNNIYDGLSNEIKEYNSGRIIPVYIDIMKSSATNGVYNFKSSNNIFKNNIVDGEDKINSMGFYISRHDTMNNFMFVNDMFDNINAPIYIKSISGIENGVEDVYISSCQFINAVKPISYAATKDVPKNLYVDNNYNYKRISYGTVVFLKGSKQLDVPHNMKFYKNDEYNVYLSIRGGDDIITYTKYINSFLLKKDTFENDITIDWIVKAIEY